MKYTNKYHLAYYEEGDYTDGMTEITRWATIDAQLTALFRILGNGVGIGWDLEAGEGLQVKITRGYGHVAFVAVMSQDDQVLSNLTPSSRNYIYAQLTSSSYWSQNVNFVAHVNNIDDANTLYIGYADTDATSVVDVNTDNRSVLGFRSMIESIVSNHRHKGGTDNPDPIDLSSEVQGILSQENLPDIDADLVKTGTLDQQRLPQIDHDSKLTSTGSLTHNQLESFVETLSIEDNELMGETSVVNLLQLVLALQHIYPGIDEFLVNHISYIPGISPDDYVDWTNTTADVDTKTAAEGGTHTITASSSDGLTAYTKIWDDEQDYDDVTAENVYVSGNTISLATTRDELKLDDFSNITSWTVTTQDLSSLSAGIQIDSENFVNPSSSGKITIGSQEADMALVVSKSFSAQDWSQYKYLRFYIHTNSVEHGDLIFYLRDGDYGVQNSHTKIIDRNTPTVNIDTLEEGWQEVVIDISQYHRFSVNMMVVYTSTQEGWDTSREFVFNIDSFSLDTGNLFEENGYVRTVFGGNTKYDFDRLRWDAVVPDKTGVEIKSRYRTANTTTALTFASWYDYSVSDETILDIPDGDLYHYIEIEIYLAAADDQSVSPVLQKLYLDFYVNDTESSFALDSRDDWESGSLFNIDTSTNPGSIQVSGTEDIGRYFYGTSGKMVSLDSDMSLLMESSGTALPRSTHQHQSDSSPGLGMITGIDRGNDGNLWITDIDNDRVCEIDKYGFLVRGFYGSFLTVPEDPYGREDNGPGSNTDVEDMETNEVGGGSSVINIVHSIYNPETGILYAVFDDELENIYSTETQLDYSKIYIKLGTQRFNLHASNFELLGVEEDVFNSWYEVSVSENADEYAPYIDQFNFHSHVLKITIQGADKAYLNYLINQERPTLRISSPSVQQSHTSDNVTVYFSINNFTLGSVSGQNAIRVRIDNGSWETIYDNKITFNSLSKNSHTVEAQLVDADEGPLTDERANASVDFLVVDRYHNEPIVNILNPLPNQVYSSSPVTVSFDVRNFAIVPSGQHLLYQIDSEPSVDLYSTEEFVIEDIDPGVHTLRLYLVDEDNKELDYSYGSATVQLIVGLNLSALPKLYIDQGAVYDWTDSKPVVTCRDYIDVANITMTNMYAPIDVQVLPYDTSGLVNGTSIIVAKMRSRSWISDMSGQDYADEWAKRVEHAMAEDTENEPSSTLDESLSSIETGELIYGTKYLNGHSVVQIDMNGNVVFSNNAARFADDKEKAKDILGSAEKVGDSELVIGDSINQRAIITYTDLETEKPVIQWEYDSDRYIIDFHVSHDAEEVINIYDDCIEPAAKFIRSGTSIKWVNKSSSVISIYSGKTDYDTFQEDPDLSYYGDVFYSNELSPGDSFTFDFNSYGQYDWFVYPGILTGQVNVTNYRLSSQDSYYILEGDGLESPFTSRCIKVDSWGNVLWSFGESYLVKPRDVRPMKDSKVLVSV